MNHVELLRLLLATPEISCVGSQLERGAFVATRIEGRSVREAAESTGASKSNIKALADVFQAKLATRMTELRAGRMSDWSPVFREIHGQLSALVPFDYDDDDSWMSAEDRMERTFPRRKK